MDAGGLVVFAAVARAGVITKAAQSLNTVQTNVTKRIRLLEAELGVPLFHRHSRGVRLTSAGAQLLLAMATAPPDTRATTRAKRRESIAFSRGPAKRRRENDS